MTAPERKKLLNQAKATIESFRPHLFPESPLHHLANCWCDEAENWRTARAAGISKEGDMNGKSS